jgi:poly(ADP-ribose) glycohydrolase ARH3
MMDARMGKGTYTDDTEMMIATAESLIASKGFDGKNMAQYFLNNFHSDRGYGPGTIKAFSLIKSGILWDSTGGMIFDGGSFGNGAAMRIAPIGLFYYDDQRLLRRIAGDASRITHAHLLGMEGAILQSYTVSQAILMSEHDTFNIHQFLQKLIDFIIPEAEAYRTKLERAETLLTINADQGTVAEQLGHDSTALNSVPTAIYCFLSHLDSFEEALVYAVGLGGDTDTIASMTGAISGAYHGKKCIPSRWMRDVENTDKGRDYIEELAIKLWELKTTTA